MQLQILLILLLQVALVESLVEVSGYIGDNINLPSGANQSWTLSSIGWWILSNKTYIATYRSGKINKDRFDQYKGRLDLNISSGDLMIHNLKTEDAMVYNVEVKDRQERFNEEIKLTVRERLQKPIIRTHTWVPSGSVKRSCWVELNCSSLDEGVKFSWQVNPFSVTTLNTSHSDGNSAILLAFLTTTQDPVNFTCTTTRNTENALDVVSLICEDDKLQPTAQPCPQPRKRSCAVIVMSAFVGSLLPILMIHLFGEKVKR